MVNPSRMIAFRRMILVGATLVACRLPTAMSFSPLLRSSFSSSFVTSNRWTFGTGSSFAAKRHNNDDEHYRDAMALNKARTDIRNFLTQRALQSFIFLLLNCRDGATVRWLEERYEFKNIENFHGTGALNLTKWDTWESILTDMLLQPKDVIVISTRSRGRRQGSKNNPYIEEQFVDFEIDIDPPSLVSRIISVRDQIAREWTADLDTLVTANEMILDAYHEAQGAHRDQEVRAEAPNNFTAVDNDADEADTEECLNYDEQSNDCVDTTGLIAPYSDSSYEDKVKEHSQKKAYDRSAMMVLGNNIVQDGRASSPFRKGSFDLLGLLATQESIHRVLREYREAGDERDVSFEWLRDFYVARAASYFDGSQEYGRADDFLEELLLTAPAVKEMDGSVGLIDPMRIAEDIIAMRTEVAQDWRDIVAEVPNKDHMELRKLILAIQMGKTVERTTASEELPSSIFEEEGFQ